MFPYCLDEARTLNSSRPEKAGSQAKGCRSMLHFAPTEEQEEIRQLARSLAVEQLRPHGRDAEKRGHVPPDVARTIAQTGLTTPFPEQYGGSGAIEAITY